MEIEIIAIPYDSGYKTTRMGRGPGQFLLHGAAWRLADAGHSALVQLVEAGEGLQTEIGTSFELHRLTSTRVRAACERGAFPLVLAGNCGSALGALSGLGMDGLGLVWFDAHGDFNTPETTTSGFLDGMVLATATGRCWRSLAASIPGFSPLPENHLVHIGARQLDPQEEDLLARSGVALITADRLRKEGVREAVAPVLADLHSRVQRLYLHIDLDALDSRVAPANEFSLPGGLEVDQVLDAIRLIQASFPVVGCGIASYDPEADKDGRTLRAGFRLMEGLIPASRSK